MPKLFEKGNSGRPKGATNLLTRTVKDTVLSVFNDLQKDPKSNMLEWGRKNPSLFYQIAAKLIPTEISAQIQERVFTVVVPDEVKYAEIIENDRNIQDNES